MVPPAEALELASSCPLVSSPIRHAEESRMLPAEGADKSIGWRTTTSPAPLAPVLVSSTATAPPATIGLLIAIERARTASVPAFSVKVPSKLTGRSPKSS